MGVRSFAYHPGSVMTKLAQYGLPPEIHSLLIDTPELAGGFCVFLSAPGKHADADVFKGKYLWDVEDMMRQGKGTEAEARWLLMKLVIKNFYRSSGQAH
ncbi:hypothetical protein DAEQUDRAFT_730869 [Daedalea quercina L-15889]|uniref:NAD(P)-binding protein n=1 Tax=Daedalea quercina L-15889 TaxID=1314783 RepID=A0A165MPC6_9APHY|nr:hypothetical protein DAEQUDRAFT_730869 [Daedalea quercina L-15889]